MNIAYYFLILFLMLHTVKNFLTRWNIYLLILLSCVTLWFHLLVNHKITQLYSASWFPVPYFVWQTSFDSEKIEWWYAQMLQWWTLDIYVSTQLFDFVLILSVVLMWIVLTYTIIRLFPEGHVLRKNALYLSLLLPLAGVFDICENLVSFIMIAHPSDISQWIAVIYSSFAVLKFIFWGWAYLVIPVILLWWIIRKIPRK